MPGLIKLFIVVTAFKHDFMFHQGPKCLEHLSTPVDRGWAGVGGLVWGRTVLPPALCADGVALRFTKTLCREKACSSCSWPHQNGGAEFLQAVLNMVLKSSNRIACQGQYYGI